MKPKSFELTIDERNTLLDVLWHCMEANVCCNVTTDGEWTDTEREAEWEKMQALCDKLAPKQLEEGWVLTFSDKHGTRIEKFDEDTQFNSDLEALVFVIQQAQSGSQYHINALAECGY